MTTDMHLRAGIVGLGRIGGGVGVSLARSGVPAAAVYDVRPDAADALEGVPAVSASAAEVAHISDVVIVAVNTGDEARAAIAGQDGVLAGARPGTIVALLSTVSLDVVRDLATACEQQGVTLLDAGVTNGNASADNGLVVMVGGADEQVEIARPVIEAFAAHVIHCGPLGSGIVTKLARNAVTYSTWAAIREATGVVTAAGVDPAKLLEVMKTAGDTVSPTIHLELMVGGYKPTEESVEYAVVQAHKDLDAQQELAAEVGLYTPIADVVRPRMAKVYTGDLDEKLPEEPRERGRAAMDLCYGPGYNELVADEMADSVPSIGGTIDYLFPQVWARPYLPMRDRRLLVVGVTAMLGRADLLETQLRGGVAAGEFTTAQLRELAMHLHPYAGWPNGTNLMYVTEKLIAEMEHQA